MTSAIMGGREAVTFCPFMEKIVPPLLVDLSHLVRSFSDHVTLIGEEYGLRINICFILSKVMGLLTLEGNVGMCFPYRVTTGCFLLIDHCVLLP